MAAATTLLRHIRRRRHLPISSIHLSYQPTNRTSTSPIPNPSLLQSHSNPNPNPFLLHPRSFSSHSSPQSDPMQNLIGDAYESSQIVEEVVNRSVTGDHIFPVRALISLLDSYHDLTGFPWWVIICTSTIAFRFALIPLMAFQFRKLKRIQQFMPQLPRPFPPPFSGKSYIDHFTLFRKKRLELGCPSYLWFVVAASVQGSFFLLGMTSIRRMALEHHLGFDSGGTLWFQNLTDYSHGVLGFIFPTMIAGLHYTNIQISFEKASVLKATGLLDLFMGFFKTYLKFMTLPIFVAGFCIPQGSLVYWFINSSFTLIQHLSMRHPTVRLALGLPEKVTKSVTAGSEAPHLDIPIIESLVCGKQQRTVSAHDLTPDELLKLSVKYLSEHKKDKAITLLRLIMEKDPEYTRALVVLGQAFLQDGQLGEAADHFERAISKILVAGQPIEGEKVDTLLLASQCAGIAHFRQNKTAESLIHLKRIASMDEPEDPTSKSRYYDGLLLLSSALYTGGHKEEATEYLRKIVAYDPSRQELLDQCEKDDDLASDLVNNRRGD